MVRDIGYALQHLRKNPAFAAVAILSLTLGIGANTAVFSLINSLMLRKLPVKDPAKLMLVAGDNTGSYELFDRVRRSGWFAGALAYAPAQFNLAPKGESDLVDGMWASGSFFETAGINPAFGRTFTDADERGGGSDGLVAVISHSLWQRRFNGSRDVIGMPLTLNRVAFTIIGVTAEEFFGLDIGRTFDVIVPIAALPSVLPERRPENWSLFSIFVRLKPEQTTGESVAVLRSVQLQIQEETLPAQATVADRRRPQVVTLIPAASVSFLRKEYERSLLTMMTVVVIVLLIACANIANLLLARSAARRHEMSVRLALGASRGRLIRQLLTESVMLAAFGAAAGTLIALWGSQWVLRELSNDAILPVGLPLELGSLRLSLDLSLDWHVLAFTALTAIATALLFGVVPAIRASSGAPMDALKEQRPSAADGKGRFGTGLVIAQVALSLILVVFAGLFVRTFTSLARLNLGFNPERLLTVEVETPYALNDQARRVQMHESLLDAVRSVPGVADVAVSLATPPREAAAFVAFQSSGTSRANNTKEERAQKSAPNPDTMENSAANLVSPGWFRTMGISLLAGRDFNNRDRKGNIPVVIVNEAFVREFFKGESPVGKAVELMDGLSPEEEPQYRKAGEGQGKEMIVLKAPTSSEKAPAPRRMAIVGVVSDIVSGSLREGNLPVLYRPIAQFEENVFGFPGIEMAKQPVSLTARAVAGSPLSLTKGIAAAIGSVNKDAGLTFQSVEAQIAAMRTQERVVAMVSAFFGALALVIAGIGLYGVTAYSVARRRREIAVRITLGAEPASVIRLVLSRISMLVGVGVTIGVAASLWGSRYVAPLLYGLAPHDPVTLAGAAVVLVIVGLLAAWLPVRRASRIDPAVVLRAE
jgi:predicted permease